MIKKIFTLLCLCTLCIGSAWGDYVKVTEAPEDWSGEYLLVYENGDNSVAWTGVDAASCNVSVTIDDGKISGKLEKAVTITIAPMTGGYSIKVNGGDNDGKFIKGTSNSNALGFETTAQLNTISYDATNKGVMITSNTSVMRYNPDKGNYRFRYFKSATYSSQKIVQLYKKQESTKTLSSITVKTAPSKTEYFVGDYFNPAGLAITATYDTGDPEDIAYAGNEDKFSFSPALDAALATTDENVTITYGGKETTQAITVSTVELTSIVVSGTPTKKEYFVGESFNPAGLTVTGHYNNGTQATITEGITWTITPETFTETTQNSVSVTATVNSITSNTYEVTGLTITSPASAYTLTAEPAEGGSYSVTVGDDPAVDVTTEAKQFMVTEGTVIQVEATANEHYQFNKFTGSYADETEITFDANGSPNKKRFTYETADATITANFRQMYAVNIDENIEHGTVTADKAEATTTSIITLTLTPDAHYHFGSVTVTDVNGDDIELYEDPTTIDNITTAKFRIPGTQDKLGAVSVTATFAEDAKYTVTFSVNGVESSSEGYAGEPVLFPENPTIAGYSLRGWSVTAISGTQEDAPEYVTGAVYPENNDDIYYAVFAKKEGEEKYVKVTSSPTNWSGEYLVVYEAGNVAFNSGAETLDAVNNSISVTINNGVIAANETTNGATIDIQAVNDDYVIQAKNGQYIGNTKQKSSAADNGLTTSKTQSTDAGYLASISLDESGNALITVNKNGYTTFKFNNASDQTRFRFYKSGQEGVALYKKYEATYSDYCTTVPPRKIAVSVSENAATGLTTMYVDYATEIPEGVEAWYVSAYDATEDKLTMTQINGYVPANTAIIVKGTAGESYNFVETFETVDAISGTNLLTGSVTDSEAQTYTTDDGWYYLATSGNFKKYEGTGIVRKAHKAYLYLTDRTWSQSAKELTIDWGEPTGIKTIDNGQLTIDNSKAYNLNGVRVNQAYKGIVIMNGKKYINK